MIGILLKNNKTRMVEIVIMVYLWFYPMLHWFESWVGSLPWKNDKDL